MAYIIKNTRGSTLVTLPDGRIDERSTSLSLIGKSVNSYGESYNENLIGLLENFASESQPRSPIEGQLWYNTNLGRLYVYKANTGFKPIIGALVGSTQPISLSEGDLWIDSVNDQVYFSKDGINLNLLGPVYSSQDGAAGVVVQSLVDTSDVPRKVTELYNNGVLLGVLSENQFNIKSPIPEAYTAMPVVYQGFNLNPAISNIKFIGTATSAESINGLTPDDYLNKVGNQSIDGNLTVNGSLRSVVNDVLVLNTFESFGAYGIHVGPSQDVSISNIFDRWSLVSNVVDGEFSIDYIHSTPTPERMSALYVSAATDSVGILTIPSPLYNLDILGNTRIQGNLDVTGTLTTFLSFQSLSNTIELAYNNDQETGAEGGGLILYADSNKTLTWSSSTYAWESSEHINLLGDKSYKIDGISVVNTNSLGISIVSAPGITELGVLSYLTVTNVIISGSTVGVTGTNATLTLAPTGNGTVDLSSKRITNLATPLSNFDASTKKYVDDKWSLIQSLGLALSIDITHFVNVNAEIEALLEKILPPINEPGYEFFDLPTGSRVRVLCSSIVANTAPASASVVTPTTLVNSGAGVNNVAAVTSVGVSIPITPINYVTTYTIKEFTVVDTPPPNHWSWNQDISL
jgi:hypothetical protein